MCIVGNDTGVKLENVVSVKLQNVISVKTIQLRNTVQAYAGVSVWGFKPHRRLRLPQKKEGCRIVKSGEDTPRFNFPTLLHIQSDYIEAYNMDGWVSNQEEVISKKTRDLAQ